MDSRLHGYDTNGNVRIAEAEHDSDIKRGGTTNGNAGMTKYELFFGFYF
jgi:hypothetical protein